MDRRSWPWKKRTSEKITATGPGAARCAVNHGEEDIPKKVKYVQIREDEYIHQKCSINELEDEIKILSIKLSTINEELSAALLDNTSKENLVKQHAKVAEEAVTGWEKAEAEALALKSQLESITLLKLTAEERTSHLDGALKECMRQIRNVKEENEHKLQEVILTKTRQWEEVKAELHTQIADLDKELVRVSAENIALSRSLQERSSMLMKLTEDKAHAETQAEIMMNRVQSCEKEINSLKYEYHVVSKELEIRNEERNMSLKSADASNKQHLDDVKKIAKLEVECQRLRGLVRKKLPGPAALAQMKLEVENLGYDYGETRTRRAHAKSSSPKMSMSVELTQESIQKGHKEVEYLRGQLLAMEEEKRLLGEALSKSRGDLQASRNSCAKTVNKVRSLEAQVQLLSKHRNLPKTNVETTGDCRLCFNGRKPASLTSMSEDGTDDDARCGDSWATALISELSQIKKDKETDPGKMADLSKHMELMDDFLEMERLACQSETAAISTSVDMVDERNEAAHHKSDAVPLGGEEAGTDGLDSEFVKSGWFLEQIRSRISSLSDAMDGEVNAQKILENIRRVANDIEEALPRNSVGYTIVESQKAPYQEAVEALDDSISVACDKQCIETKQPLDHELSAAIHKIYDFVVSLGKDARESPGVGEDNYGLSQRIDELSSSLDRVLSSEIGLNDFVRSISYILTEFDELGYKISCARTPGETTNYDCIDKLTLLENKVDQSDQAKGRFSSDFTLVASSISDSEIPHDGCLGTNAEPKAGICKCSQGDVQHVRRDASLIDLSKCRENLEEKRVQLETTEKLLEDIKSELSVSKKSNSLAETQLKCMTESYRALERRSEDLEADVDILRGRVRRLEIELQEEKQNHEGALMKCNDLEVKCRNLDEEIQRRQGGSTCSPSYTPDGDKFKQEKEIATAAEKLAECQETIFLLSKQLNAMRRPAESAVLPHEEMARRSVDIQEKGRSAGGLIFYDHGFRDLEEEDLENLYTVGRKSRNASPVNVYDVPISPSESEPSGMMTSPVNSKRRKHRPTKSSSSSSLSMTPEKPGRGFSRFFSRVKAH